MAESSLTTEPAIASPGAISAAEDTPQARTASRIQRLTDAQCYELAHLHRLRGFQAPDIAKRWPGWEPHEISRALRSARVQEALELIESDARNAAGTVQTVLNLAGFETTDRWLDVARGKATYTNDEGHVVPFSEKSQMEAMRWHLERILPERPQIAVNVGPTFNNTVVAATLADTVKTLSAISSQLRPGASAVGSGDPTADPGPEPATMDRYLRKGREQLVPNDEVPLTIDVPAT